jgi:2-polyprenyl-6-methoxyphenol hydroxylase-like FAD-dependent oxidoreductase
LKLLPLQPATNSRIGSGAIVSTFARDFYTVGTIFMCCDKGGYVGLVRLENGLLDIAAAFDPEFVRQQGGAGRAADQIMKASALPNIPNLPELEWHGTPPLTRHRQVAADRIFVIGDSASYGEPFTGEGMGWAMTAAKAVVPFVLDAISSNENFDCTLWPKQHKRQIADRQRTSKMLGKLLRQPQMVELTTKAITLLPSMAESLARHITKSAVNGATLSNTL